MRHECEQLQSQLLDSVNTAQLPLALAGHAETTDVTNDVNANRSNAGQRYISANITILSTQHPLDFLLHCDQSLAGHLNGTRFR